MQCRRVRRNRSGVLATVATGRPSEMTATGDRTDVMVFGRALQLISCLRHAL
jgi:hypothetical protein